MNIFRQINKKVIIHFIKKRPGDVPEVYANIKKLTKILRWKPKHNDLEKILKSAFKWEKKLSK